MHAMEHVVLQAALRRAAQKAVCVCAASATAGNVCACMYDDGCWSQLLACYTPRHAMQRITCT